MGGIRALGLVAFVPLSVLLTISFFVLLVLRKVEEPGLRIFGYAVTTLLWVAAAIVFMLGINLLSGGQAPRGCMMSQMMGAKMPMMGRPSAGMMPSMHQPIHNQSEMPAMPH